MPKLSTSLHLDMLRGSRNRRTPLNALRAVKRALLSRTVYGSEWGDPDTVPPLEFVKERYVLPYVERNAVAVEIGPGGGRWTKYLLDFERLYVVDYHRELLSELRQTFKRRNMVFVQNNGCDFPGIPDHCADYVFSFGCFVHLDAELIAAYLENLRRIVKPHSTIVIHYSDKTKIMAVENTGFAQNDPTTMRRMVTDAGYTILEEDLTSLWHSSIIRFTPELAVV